MEADYPKENDEPEIIDLEEEEQEQKSTPDLSQSSIIIVSTSSLINGMDQSNEVEEVKIEHPLDLTSPIVHKSPADILKRTDTESIIIKLLKNSPFKFENSKFGEDDTDMLTKISSVPLIDGSSTQTGVSDLYSNQHLPIAGPSSRTRPVTSVSAKIDDFLDSCKMKMTAEEFNLMIIHLRDLLEPIDTVENESEILDEIEVLKWRAKKGKVWTSIKKLKIKLINLKEGKGPKLTPKQLKRKNRIEELEDHLGELNKKIKEIDEEEVAWESEDENNSAFLIRDRYIKRAEKVHTKICEYSNSSISTGRSVEKKFILKKKCLYPALKYAVERFITRKDHWFIPDYADILKVVKRTSRKEKLKLEAFEISTITLSFFHEAVAIIKSRRTEDSKHILTERFDEIEGPEANDPILLKKLQENDAKRKPETEVLKEFCKIQKEQKAEAKEYEIGSDSSFPSEDDEEVDSDDDESNSSESNKSAPSDDILEEITLDEVDNTVDSTPDNMSDKTEELLINLDDSDGADNELPGEEEIDNLLKDDNVDESPLPEAHLLTDDES